MKKEIDLTKCPRLAEWIGDSEDNSSFMDDLEALVQSLPDMVLAKEDAISCNIEAAINAVSFTINNMRQVAKEIFREQPSKS